MLRMGNQEIPKQMMFWKATAEEKEAGLNKQRRIQRERNEMGIGWLI